MKNYALTKEEENSFILNYKIVNDKKLGKAIIINLATGIKVVDVYSKEKEIAILEKMKEQILRAKKCYEREKNNIRRCYKKSIGYFIFCLIIANSKKIFSQKEIKLICGIEILAIIYNLIVTLIAKNKMNDIDKNYLFIQNKHLFDGDLDNDFLSLINKKSKMIIIKDGNVNLTNIDKISYNDFVTLVDTIRKEKCYQLSGVIRKK